jgi:hypothetical protein
MEIIFLAAEKYIKNNIPSPNKQHVYRQNFIFPGTEQEL